MEDLKDVWVRPFDHQVTKIDTFLYDSEEEELVTLIKRNIDLFAYAPYDMIGRDTRVVSPSSPLIQ